MLKILKIYCFYQLRKKIDLNQRADKTPTTTTTNTTTRQCSNCRLARQLPESNDLTQRTSQSKRKPLPARKRGGGSWRVEQQPTNNNKWQCCCCAPPAKAYVGKGTIKLKRPLYGTFGKSIAVGKKKSDSEKLNVRKSQKLNEEYSNNWHINTKETAKATAASGANMNVTHKIAKQGLRATYREAKQQSCPKCKKLQRNASKMPTQNATSAQRNAKSLLGNTAAPCYGAMSRTTLPATDRLYSDNCRRGEQPTKETFYTPEDSTETPPSLSMSEHLNLKPNASTSSLLVHNGSLQTPTSTFTTHPDDAQYNAWAGFLTHTVPATQHNQSRKAANATTQLMPPQTDDALPAKPRPANKQAVESIERASGFPRAMPAHDDTQAIDVTKAQLASTATQQELTTHAELDKKVEPTPKALDMFLLQLFRPLTPQTNLKRLHKPKADISKPAAALNKSQLNLHSKQCHVAANSLANLSPHMQQLLGLRTNRRHTAAKRINQRQSSSLPANLKRAEPEKGKKLCIAASPNSIELASLSAHMRQLMGIKTHRSASTDTTQSNSSNVPKNIKHGGGAAPAAAAVSKQKKAHSIKMKRIARLNNSSTRQLDLQSDGRNEPAAGSVTQTQLDMQPTCRPTALLESSWSPRMRRLLGLGAQKPAAAQGHASRHKMKASKPANRQPFQTAAMPHRTAEPLQTAVDQTAAAAPFVKSQRKTAGMSYVEPAMPELALSQLAVNRSSSQPCIEAQQISLSEESDRQSNTELLESQLTDLQLQLLSSVAEPKPTTAEQSDLCKSESDNTQLSCDTAEATAADTTASSAAPQQQATTETNGSQSCNESVGCLGDIRQLFNVVSTEDIRRMRLGLGKQQGKKPKARHRKTIGHIGRKSGRAIRVKSSASQTHKVATVQMVCNTTTITTAIEFLYLHRVDHPQAEQVSSATDCIQQTTHKLCFYYMERVLVPCQLATTTTHKQQVDQAVLSTKAPQLPIVDSPRPALPFSEHFAEPSAQKPRVPAKKAQRSSALHVAQSVQTDVSQVSLKAAVQQLNTSKSNKKKISRQPQTADQATQTWPTAAHCEPQARRASQQPLRLRKCAQEVQTVTSEQWSINTEAELLSPNSSQEKFWPKAEIVYNRPRFIVRAKSCHDLYSSSSSSLKELFDTTLAKYTRPADCTDTATTTDVTTGGSLRQKLPTRANTIPSAQAHYAACADSSNTWPDLSSSGSSSDIFVQQKPLAEFITTLPCHMQPRQDAQHTARKYCLYEFRTPDVCLSNLKFAKAALPIEQNHTAATCGAAQTTAEAYAKAAKKLAKQQRELASGSKPPARSASWGAAGYMGAYQPIECSVHNCGGLLTPSGLMAHYAHEHCDWLGHMGRVHCQKIYASGSRRVFANYADFVLDQVRFLGMLAYGGIRGARLPAKRRLCATNMLLPSSMAVLQQHLPIILYACKLNATRLIKHPGMSADCMPSAKLAKNEILVVWAACYPLPFPLWVKVTVSDKHCLSLHERSMRVRYFHEFSQEPRHFVASESDFLLLTYAELKALTKRYTSDMFFDIVIKEQATRAEHN